MKSFGIVYISFGGNYVDCTVAALKSKITRAPNTPAMVITNRKADLDSTLCKQGGIHLQYVDCEPGNVREVKTQLYKYSPYEYTLLLDADALINKELSEEFKLLDYGPMALTHAYHHPSVGSAVHTGVPDREHTVTFLKGLRSMPQYASGLLFFRRDDPLVQRTFDVWQQEYRVFKNKDQLALIRAMATTGCWPIVVSGRYWLTPDEGKGFVSHRFTRSLPSMPRKDIHSPKHYLHLP